MSVMNKFLSLSITAYFSLFFFLSLPSKSCVAADQEELSVEHLFNEHVDSIVLVAAQDRKVSRLGSGFIIREDGWILTNAHVIKNAKSIIVKLRNNKVCPNVRVLYCDVDHDVALLKVDAGNLKAVTLGNSNKIHIGERVVTIGNPLGLESTISDGLISSWRTVHGYKTLQISVPLSEGSSGGPLFNLQGEVIGITTASYLKGQNLNFAIPINYIKPFLSKVILLRTTNGSEFASKQYSAPRRIIAAKPKNQSITTAKQNNYGKEDLKKNSVHSRFYVVNPNDTLFSLAKKFHVTVPELMQINELKSDKISSGQKIKIPGP